MLHGIVHKQTEPQIFWRHDIDISRSRDVIDHAYEPRWEPLCKIKFHQNRVKTAVVH